MPPKKAARGGAWPNKPLTPEQQLARKNAVGRFLLMGAGAAGMAGVWHWLNVVTPDGDISGPLRSVLGGE